MTPPCIIIASEKCQPRLAMLLRLLGFRIKAEHVSKRAFFFIGKVEAFAYIDIIEDFGILNQSDGSRPQRRIPCRCFNAGDLKKGSELVQQLGLSLRAENSGSNPNVNIWYVVHSQFRKLVISLKIEAAGIGQHVQIRFIIFKEMQWQ